MTKSVAPLAIALAVLAATSVAAHAHTMSWPNGSSRQVGIGHCAKGACMKRSWFASSVPHRHVGNGQCEGQSAGGFRFRC